MKNNAIDNLDDILKFLATHPKLTHGDGDLYASVCNAIDYKIARQYITNEQNKGFIRYAAFVKRACNCARFVTDTLIASVTNLTIKKNLQNSKWFTPSTIGNVTIADTENFVYVVTDKEEITEFESTVSKENRRLFLDTLKDYKPSLVGTLEPKHNDEKAEHAQWLSGIAAGAWFELYKSSSDGEYRFRRISPYGNIDVDDVYVVDDSSFTYESKYEFIHYSNCAFFHIKQNGMTYKFIRKEI